MAIEYGIDVEKKVLLLKGVETLTAEDLLAYLREVVSRPEVAGFSGLVDLTGVSKVVLSTMGKFQLFAQLSGRFGEAWNGSRLAIVSDSSDLFGLRPLYDNFGGGQGSRVGLFADMGGALEFLGFSGGEHGINPIPLQD